MKSTVKPLKIHIGKMGGVRIDEDEFFARPGVQEKMKKLAEMDITGKTLNELISGKAPKEASKDKEMNIHELHEVIRELQKSNELLHQLVLEKVAKEKSD